MESVNSKLEDIIDQMQDLIENSRYTWFSNTNISVDREVLEDLVRQFRENLPAEIERYRKMLSNKDAVEKNAQEKADRLLAQVRQQANDILSESEIMSRAQKQADELVATAAEEADRILADAQFQANAYMDGAQRYLSDMLQNLSGMIYDCIDSTTRNTNRFLESINAVGQTVQENLNELNNAPAAPESAQPVAEEPKSIFDQGDGNGVED